MILLYITGQWGQDLPSKYSPSVSSNVSEEIKDRSCLDKRRYSSVAVLPTRIKVGGIVSRARINFSSSLAAVLLMACSCRPSFLREKMKVGVGPFANCPISSPPSQKSLFQVVWEENGLISRLVERDL